MGDEHLRDLGRTPLLLGLLCLTYEKQGAFPQKRADLYQQALDALLIQWDEFDKNIIERDAMRRAEIYHQLSLGRKYQMFAQIAYETFGQGEILIPQERLERLVTDYLVTVPDAPERIDIDASAVLQAIEAQHGILVRQAHGDYSFVNLSFHEYFAARYIADRANGGDASILPCSLPHAHEDRWREAILLTASMLDETDEFSKYYLTFLDALVRDDPDQIAFLTWLQRKARAVNAPYKPAATRGYYAYHAYDLYHVLNRPLDLDHLLVFTLALTLDRDLVRDLDRARDLALDRDLARAHARVLNRDLNCNLVRDLDLARVHAKKLGLAALATALDALSLPPNEAPAAAWDKFAHDLQAIMIQHRDIGHNWDFTEEQAETLEHYFVAACLLVECLNVANISAADRAAIEDRLLLPPQEPPE
ncbi:MAG: hypothetical protein JXA33_16940 [Anaerolineae bacterium]|nr:hypothetical protein [Anaerolineae bacterium]